MVVMGSGATRNISARYGKGMGKYHSLKEDTIIVESAAADMDIEDSVLVIVFALMEP